MKILMLEDNPLDADLSTRAIIKEIGGSEVVNAPTLALARQLLGSGTVFDLALLDMNLPDGNGLELLTEIRESGTDMAVILFTSTGNEEVAVAALKAGADDYIAKKQGYSVQLPSLIKLTFANYIKNKKNQSRTIKVLYVEHNSTDVDLTLRHLKKYAPQLVVEVVYTAETALLKLENSKVASEMDVILMDYRLTGINALDFIKTVRQKLLLDIPIIIVSGQGDEQIATQAIKLGANDYLTKNENYLFSLPLMITNVHQQTELIRKQAMIMESEAKYRLIAENAGDVVFTLDRELNYTYISPSIKNLLGYDPDEIMRHRIGELLTPESSQRVKKILTEILEADHQSPQTNLEKQIIELEILRKDGGILWTEIKASHLVGTPAIPEGILCVARDISRRKKAMEELRKLSRAVEQSHSSILITNVKGEIEYVNPALSLISGYSLEELLGKDPSVLGAGEIDEEITKDLWDTISKGNVWNGEFCNRKKNGEIYWESATISPITDSFGNITHYVDIRKDITEQKRVNMELIEAKIRAEESDRLKSAFLANMSHEIRSPLNSIMGFASLLEGVEEKETIVKYSSIIYKSSEQLVHIIDDIVLYSKLQTNLLSIKEVTFELDQLLEEIEDVHALPEYHQSTKLVVVPAPQHPGVIHTDREKLKQVLVNLISNAYKYTSEGTIWVGCIAEADHFRFFVEDTGMGIPADELDKVFDRFFRGRDALRSVIGGTGLGLSIVKELVSLLGGVIWAESEVGKGTTFYFTVPYKEIV
ncbi:MAG: PAS domain S-box protein [Candidatus Saccharibacteria bacterium]